jgi:hypothetical protein
MEDIVRAAMAKWPNVPAVFGWLSLTARGEWRIRGEPIGNAAIRSFIDRNYGKDERGNWFFQNGPQRVYAELELAPWIIHLDGAVLCTHTGAAVGQLHEVCADERGQLYLLTEHGPGALDDRDAPAVAEWLCDETGAALDETGLDDWLANRSELLFTAQLAGTQRELRVGRIEAAEVPARYGFRRRPAPGT